MTDSGTDVPVVGGDNGDSGVAGTTIRRLVWVALVAVLAVIAVPGWASFSYRSAVHDLHRELAATEIDSVTIDDAAGRAVVAADPFDDDMVSCLPF